MKIKKMFPSVSQFRLRAQRVARLAPLWVFLAAPFFMFPNRWTPFLLPLLLLPWLARPLGEGQLTRRTGLEAPLSLLLITTVIGYHISPDQSISQVKLWGIVLQITIFFTLVNSLDHDKAVRQARLIFIGGTAFLAFLGLIGTDWSVVRLVSVAALYDNIPLLLGRSGPIFHPREIGLLMAMLLPLLLTSLPAQTGRWRLSTAGVILLALTMLILSQAIMGYWGLAVALCLLGIWQSPRWVFGLLGLGLTFLVALVLIIGPQRLALAMLDIQNILGVGFVLRFDIWSRALAMIGDMPFTGIGLSAFPLVQTHFYPGYLLGPEVHSHNLILQAALDFGLPGLMALIWLLAAFTNRVVQAYQQTADQEVKSLLVGASAGVLAYVSGGLMDVTMLGRPSAVVLWLLLGLAIAVALQVKSNLYPPAIETRKRSFTLLALFMIFWLLAAVALPSRWQSNLGLVQAHQALYQARITGGLPVALAQRSVALLNQVLLQEPERPQIFGLLGSLNAWQEQPEAALAALAERVWLDGHNPDSRYAPFIGWKRRLLGQPAPDRWDSTLEIYSQWLHRFPERAETYVLVALVWDRHKSDPDCAANMLQVGLDAGAVPQSLLIYYLEELSTEAAH